jgi:hypothetical protein
VSYDYPNFRQEIEDLVDELGEPILWIVVGQNSSYYSTRVNPFPHDNPVPWEEAAPHLDYTYDDGYGSADCHPITAWTESYIIKVHEDDGSTSLVTFPRHPTKGSPGWA